VGQPYFEDDYMDPNYVSLLNMLRATLEASIDPGWLHTRYNPINSPGRGGGGMPAAVVKCSRALASSRKWEQELHVLTLEDTDAGTVFDCLPDI
jgi:hypothetical protein